MNKFLFFLLSFFIFIACENEPEKSDTTPVVDTIVEHSVEPVVKGGENNIPESRPESDYDIREEYKGSNLLWIYDDFNNEAIKLNDPSPEILNPQSLINLINTKEIKADFVKISNDTIFIKIADSFYLTQSCGTAGAAFFMASTTYTLTELEGIRYVNFDFEIGDHAMPGTYSRRSFKKARAANSG